MSSVKDWTASVIKQAEIDKYLDGGKDFIDEEPVSYTHLTLPTTSRV